MATRLTKSISREVFLDRRTMVVTLNPDSTISFRQKGKRTTYTAHLHAAYNMAVIAFVQDDYDTRLDTYEAKKKSGIYKHLRKPKKPNLSGIFSQTHFVAIKNSKK